MARAEQPGEEAIGRGWVWGGSWGVTGHDEGPGVYGVCNEKPRQGFRRESCMIKSGPFLVLRGDFFLCGRWASRCPLPLEAHTLMWLLQCFFSGSHETVAEGPQSTDHSQCHLRWLDTRAWSQTHTTCKPLCPLAALSLNICFYILHAGHYVGNHKPWDEYTLCFQWGHRLMSRRKHRNRHL